MIYVNKDSTGYQSFPVPANLEDFIQVDGADKDAIIAGRKYLINGTLDGITLETDADKLARELTATKADKNASLSVTRTSKLNDGFSYVFPDGISGTIQTKQSDMININGLVTAGQLNPSGSFNFRDLENVSHTLTGTQITEMGMSALGWVSEQFQTSWDLKDTVESATTAAAVDAVSWPA